MSENSKIHLQRLKTGIAGAIIATVALGNNPTIVKAEIDTYEDQETTNVESVYDSVEMDSTISEQSNSKNEEISQSDKEELDEAEEIDAEVTEHGDFEQKNHDVQESKSDLIIESDVEIPEHNEKANDKLEEPVLKSIIFDKDEYMHGDEAVASVTVASELPIETIEIELQLQFNDSDGYNTTYWASDFIEDDNGDYVATIQVSIDEGLIGLSFVSGKYLDSDYISYGFNNTPEMRTVNFIPNPETAGPELKHIIFDKEEYEAGDTVHYEVHLTHSRDIDYFYFRLIGENYSSSREFYDSFNEFTYDETNNHYIIKGSFQIPDHTIDDTYSLSELGISDINDNYTYFNKQYQELDEDIYFKVVNTGVTDLEGPVIEKIDSNKELYHRDEDVEVTVLLSDESIVDYLDLEFFDTEKDDYLYVSLDNFELNSDGFYESTVKYRLYHSTEGDYSKNSIYSLVSVTARDIYGNQTIISNKDYPLTIELYGKPDHEAPVLVDIEFEEGIYQVGDKVSVKVIVSEETGIEYVYLDFDKSDNSGSFYDNLSLYFDDFVYNKATDMYEATDHFYITNYQNNSTYELVSVSTGDTLYNYESYNSFNGDLPFELSFQVEGSDDEAPNVESISIKDKSYIRGEEIEVSLIVTDESAPSAIILLFETEDGETISKEITNFKKMEDGRFIGEGSIQISEIENQRLQLKGLFNWDIWQNGKLQDISDWKQFVEIKENPDKNGPVVSNIEIEKSEHMRGEDIKVSVDVSDENDINAVEIFFNTDDDYFGDRSVLIDDFEYLGDGTYRGTGTFKITYEGTIWRFTHGVATDKFLNSKTFDNESVDANHSVKIIGNPDSEAPEVVAIETKKVNYTANDKIQFTVTATDENAVDSVHLYFSIPGGYGIRLFEITDFVQIEGSNQYVGTVEVDVSSFYFEEGRYELYEIILLDEYMNMSHFSVYEDNPNFISSLFDLEFYYSDLKNEEDKEGDESTPEDGNVEEPSSPVEVEEDKPTSPKEENTDNSDPSNDEIGKEEVTKPIQKPVEIKEEKTGISVSVEGFEDPVEFVAIDVADTVEEIPEVLGSNFALFDLYLTDENGNPIGLDGATATVRIPYDPSLLPVNVYHFGDNFEIADPLDFEIEGNYIVFSTDSFSYFGVEFVLADASSDNAEDTSGTSDTSDTNETLVTEGEAESESVAKENAEDLPPTGVASMAVTQALGLLFTTLGAALGFRKKD